MLSSGELVAWWNLSHSLGGHCCTLLGALHGVRCSSQVCMYVRQSSCTLLACLYSPQLLLLAAAAASLLFFLVLFVFGFESEAQVSQFVSHGDDHPSERKKKIPGKKKIVWQALESASSKTHLQFSVDYYAQQWTGS
jgi:predicted alpha/beta hydrolase